MKNYIDEFKLPNKVVVVLGGCGLIGSEIVNALSQTEAKTVLLDNDKQRGEKIIKNLANKNVSYKYFNAADIANAESFFAELQKDLGCIDVFVNASYPREGKWGVNVEETTLDCLQNNVNVHLNSYCWISRKICLLMKKNGGSLINFGSIYGMQGNDFSIYEGTDMNSPMEYAVIKAGIINLTRYLASYFGKYNVRINTISPGGVFNNQDGQFVKKYSKKVPLKRMADKEDIVGAVVFLASDLSKYITGQNIVIDGGWSIC